MLSSKAIPILLAAFFVFVLLQWIAGGLGALAGNFGCGTFSGGRSEKAALAKIDFSFFESSGWSGYISQGYGATALSFLYVGGRHNGVDIPAIFGAPILSPVAGTVFATGNQDNYCFKKGYGKFVVVKNGDGHALLFAHLSSIAVSAGNAVKKGDVIGGVGQTGLATAPHLHFSVFNAAGFSMQTKNGCGPDPSGQDINPVPYIKSIET